MDQDLRAAIASGLHVDNLWAIVGICTDLLRAGQLHNPIIALTIKGVCSELARAQEGEAVPGDYAQLLDAHLLPAIEGLLNVSSGSPAEVNDALNALARVYADTLLRS